MKEKLLTISMIRPSGSGSFTIGFKSEDIKLKSKEGTLYVKENARSLSQKIRRSREDQNNRGIQTIEIKTNESESFIIEKYTGPIKVRHF